MASERLTNGEMGEAVSRLHQALEREGYPISTNETRRNFPGPETRAGLLRCQAERGLACTGYFDEKTAAALGNSDSNADDLTASAPSEATQGPQTSPATSAGASQRPEGVIFPLRAVSPDEVGPEVANLQ